jgi:hypothetical protein
MESKKLARLEGSDPGSQFIYMDEGGQFVVEWDDFGEGEPNESANSRPWVVSPKATFTTASRFTVSLWR